MESATPEGSAEEPDSPADPAAALPTRAGASAGLVTTTPPPAVPEPAMEPGTPVEPALDSPILDQAAALEVTASLADSPAVVSDARAMAAGALLAWACPEPVVEDTVTVISELVTNAVVHAAPPVLLRLALANPPEGRTVRIEVSDGSTMRPQAQPRSMSSPGGRGLLIVRALAARYGVLVTADGKTVWAELAATA